MNGWLFDIYHQKDRIILWIKERKGNVKRLEYLWSPSIYVASDQKSELIDLVRNSKISSSIREYQFEYKFEYPSSVTVDKHKRNVALRLTLSDSLQILNLAKRIEKLSVRFGHYRLYNVDISPEQSFLYEKDLYPLGLYNIEEIKSTESVRTNVYHIVNDKRDDIDSFEYVVPNFKFLSFELISEKKSIGNDLDDRILKIKIISFEKDNLIKEEFSISEENELETILEFAYEINRIDPDIVLTKGGDQFLFPHLFHRAKANNIENQLLINLNRESNLEYLLKKNTLFSNKSIIRSNGLSSTSYISYGKVYFKPRPFFLYGRIHIDVNNSFIYRDNGLEGLAELSRV
ncbi:MAG TPA: 3'-5' exonuclease, partial [Candidatus Nitrosocosmicus sp.]|nr:3'-5' exonuclease [Candidatus Nitrosocosmicus sp.]